ncbi:MAG TPA: DUF4339 domain-containing protein [Flavilitoribacter sp.]|nr:DUF4339 domain-containing protein [Flavilitoribacter sp.]
MGGVKEYYIARGTEKSGPFSLEELLSQEIRSNTLIWKSGWSNWKPASEVPEIPVSALRAPVPPPAPPPIFDYSRVEDKAGVDYKIAMIITAVFALFQVFGRPWALQTYGVAISTAMVCFVWYYFRKYFDAAGDKPTGTWINWIIGAYVGFGVLNLFALNIAWTEDIVEVIWDRTVNGNRYAGADMQQSLNIIQIGLLLFSMVIITVSVKIILVNHRHSSPLGWIAAATMTCIPLALITNLIESVLLSEEYIENRELTYIWSAILLLPYYFLFYHFYRADKDDASP